MKILEHNCTTNEVFERDATAEELAQRAIDEAQDVQAELDAVAKATAKAALLTQLGITEEQAKLLLS
jgi:hypothetical protein